MAEKNAEEILAQKHKQERKELQAKIQGLKKSICKGDKKRKREVIEQILQMESELNQCHDAEIANLNLSKLTINELPTETVTLPENNNSNEQENVTVPTQRISKAQKRRDKKAIAERERNERIIEQEALNIYGKRSIEIQTIKKILSDNELMIYEIPSDGHCLYNAIAHQLKANGEIPFSFHDLRQKTAVYLRNNMDDFLPFLSNGSDELLSLEQYEKYCDNVAHTSAWGGDIELQVLSKVLECPIEIIQATGAPYIIGSEFLEHKKIILTYHRHLYELGAHYNSVTKFIKEEDS